MPKSALNEDDGTDEIYVWARFKDADGVVRGDQDSNVVIGDF